LNILGFFIIGWKFSFAIIAELSFRASLINENL